MPEQQARIEFKTNVPKTIKVVKFVKSGDNKYGPWYLWEVEEDGEKKSLFPSAFLQDKLAEIKPLPATLTITKTETEDNKTRWEIAEPIFESSGEMAEARGPDILEDDNAQQRLYELLSLTIGAAKAACKAANKNELDERFLFAHEDVQKFATTLFIDLRKQY